MRILILSGSTGGGHNSTAGAVAEILDRWHIEFEITDALSLISEKTSEFVSWGHTYVYRHLPKLFGGVYRFEEKHPPKFIYSLCAKGADALQAYLQNGKYDAVICVHVFACMMMTEVRRKYGSTIPNYFVATDYTCSPGVSELSADGFFIPHRMLLSEFIRGNIPADKLIVSGIPVRSTFYEKLDPLEARERLHLPKEGKLVLLSCGSMGCGHIERKAKAMLRKLPKDSTMVVLCGNNKKAYEKLKSLESKKNVKNRLIAVDFNDRVADYMSAADVYLTKPGGLMTSEAITKRLPMVFINAVPGCETRNFKFLMKNGVADGSTHWKRAIRITIDLLNQPEKMQKMKDAMEEFIPKNSAESICRCVTKS